MKIKIKLSIIVIAIVVAVAGGLAIILLRQATSISMNLSIDKLGLLNDQQASFWEGRENRYFDVLRCSSYGADERL